MAICPFLALSALIVWLLRWMDREIKKDFKRDPTKKRDDGPLRWPANVHHTTTHDERIRWLWYENEKMYGELLTAKLLYAIALINRKANHNVFTNLQEYKDKKLAFELWDHVLEEKERITCLGLDNWRHTKDSSYYFFGDEESEN